MKTFKKLQVAAAVATMFASVGGLQAATVSQSGGNLAMETIKPGALPTPQSQFTRTRAPAVTYSFSNGPNAQANGTQLFQVMFTITGAGAPKWAFDNVISGEDGTILKPPHPGTAGGVPEIGTNLTLLVETITAKLRGLGAGRVNVRDTGTTNPDKFAIELRGVKSGVTPTGVNPAAHPDDATTITYEFALVNRTGQPISLADLDITFNTDKTAGNLNGDYYRPNNTGPHPQELDVPTSANARFGAIHNLADASVETRGHFGTAVHNSQACGPDPDNLIALRGNSAINFVQGTEPNTNVTSTTVPTYNPGYLRLRRALDIIVSNNGRPNRLIATTNSFAENWSAYGLLGINLTPTNGIGGSGGGRYTFVPTRKASQAMTFGPALNPTVVPGVPPVPVTPPVLSSGDERDAALGAVHFRNRRSGMSDRSMVTPDYLFKPGTTVFSDFNSGGVGNIGGGVDVRLAAGLPALRLVVNQTGAVAPSGNIRLVNLDPVTGTGGTCANAFDNNHGSVFMRTNLGGGVWQWDLSHEGLRNATNPLNPAGHPLDTLANRDLTICYHVPGNETIPQATWTGIVATLFKDDITEQSNISCPGDLAQVYGGVKVDVRNFFHSGAPGAAAGWQGILRIINNSETDTAQVDAQYIYNDGRYGNWGTIIPALPPRGAGYVTGGQIQGALTNVASSVAAGARWDGAPTAAQVNSRTSAGTASNGTLRLRISADVPTIRVQNYVYNEGTQALTEVSSSQGADFANIESSNRDHIDQDAQTDIKK